MEPPCPDNLALITLVAELVVAQEGGTISSDVYWKSIECVRFAHQNPEDDIIRLATGTMSMLISLIKAYPGTDRAFGSFVESVMGVCAESDKERARLNSATASAAIQTDASKSAATQTDPAVASSHYTAPARARQQAPSYTLRYDKNLILKFTVPCRFRLSKSKIRRLKRAPQGGRRCGAPDTNSSASALEPVKLLLTSPGSVHKEIPSVTEPVIDEEVSVIPAAAKYAVLQPPAGSHIAAAPAAAPAHLLCSLAEESLLQSEIAATLPATSSSVLEPKAPSQPTGESKNAPAVVRRTPFDTDFTQDDYDKIRVYNGKVDFGRGPKHRIQFAWDRYKRSTENAMMAMAGVLTRAFDKDDMNLLSDFEDRLRPVACEQLGDVVLPPAIASDLSDAIRWRKAVCAWYGNLQMAMEAEQIPSDRGYSELRDGTSSHEHFLLKLQNTAAVMILYTPTLQVKRQLRDSMKSFDNRVLVVAQHASEGVRIANEGQGVTSAEVHIEKEDLDEAEEKSNSDDGMSAYHNHAMFYDAEYWEDDDSDADFEDGLEGELDY